MKTIITYKALKIEITIDDGGCDESRVREGGTPPYRPAFNAFPLSSKDIREMDNQVEAAIQILEEK